MFNALKYTEELEKAGFSRNEAEASLKVLIEVMNENFATKSDLRELEQRMDAKFQAVDNRFQVLTQIMESRFQAVDARFSAVDARFQELEYKLTIKLGTMMIVAIATTATLIQILK